MDAKTVNNFAHQAEAAAVASIVREGLATRAMKLEDGALNAVTVLAVPKGIDVVSVKKYFDEHLDAPERREGTANLEDIESFIAHAKRFADADSALFACSNPASPALLSVLDYHRIGAASSPRFGRHRGVYSFPLSDEWKGWVARNAQVMDQAAFAELVENRITDVLDPAGAGETPTKLAEAIGCKFASPTKLLELSRGLSVRVGAKIRTAQNLATGEAALTYVSEHQDEHGAALKVPGAFLIGLPVFRNGAPYQLAVRLRYRVREGGITWFYELYRADRVFDHAFREACEHARTETGLPLYVGSPEK